jgi:hypothetical protein
MKSNGYILQSVKNANGTTKKRNAVTGSNAIILQRGRDMKLSWIKLALIAFACVIKTMREGEKSHPRDEWEQLTPYGHGVHAELHARNYASHRETKEDDISHMITRGAMIKYQEAKHGKGYRLP